MKSEYMELTYTPVHVHTLSVSVPSRKRREISTINRTPQVHSVGQERLF